MSYCHMAGIYLYHWSEYQESMSDIENKGGTCSLKLCLDYSRRPQSHVGPIPSEAAVRSESRIRRRKKDMEM